MLKEKDVALKIALKVGEYIEQNIPGVKVIYTRKDDRYVALDARAEIANKNKADLFICIHANANPNTKAFGTETFVMGEHKDEANLSIAQRENSVILMDENYEERYEGFNPNSPESYILFTLTQSALSGKQLAICFKNRITVQGPGRKGKQGCETGGICGIMANHYAKRSDRNGFFDEFHGGEVFGGGIRSGSYRLRHLPCV